MRRLGRRSRAPDILGLREGVVQRYGKLYEAFSWNQSWPSRNLVGLVAVVAVVSDFAIFSEQSKQSTTVIVAYLRIPCSVPSPACSVHSMNDAKLHVRFISP